MTPSPPGAATGGAYRSYLVRLWQSGAQGAWRASAQCVQTGNTVRFGDVESLLTFLQAELTSGPTPGVTDSPTVPADPV